MCFYDQTFYLCCTFKIYKIRWTVDMHQRERAEERAPSLHTWCAQYTLHNRDLHNWTALCECAGCLYDNWKIRLDFSWGIYCTVSSPFGRQTPARSSPCYRTDMLCIVWLTKASYGTVNFLAWVAPMWFTLIVGTVHNKIYSKCIAMNLQAGPQWTMTPNTLVVILWRSSSFAKCMVRADCCATCASPVSCRQKLWPCDCYYSTSHYIICSQPAGATSCFERVVFYSNVTILW